jgi:hypothetical protein
MVLLGDAVHAISPSLGQVASMALEDALAWPSAYKTSPIWSRRLAPMSNCVESAPRRCLSLGSAGMQASS